MNMNKKIPLSPARDVVLVVDNGKPEPFFIFIGNIPHTFWHDFYQKSRQNAGRRLGILSWHGYAVLPTCRPYGAIIIF